MMEKFMRENEENIREIFDIFFPRFKEILEKEGIGGLVEFAYGQIDYMQVKTKIKDQISCSNACNHCCHSDIDITSFEASYITSFVNQFNIPVNLELLAVQNSKGFHKLKWAQQRCSLLDEKGSCRIYDVRPIICRLHNSTEDPEQCNFSKGKNKVGTLRMLEGYVVGIVLMSLDDPIHYKLHKVLWTTKKGANLAP